jgi:hypothetical protein
MKRAGFTSEIPKEPVFLNWCLRNCVVKIKGFMKA